VIHLSRLNHRDVAVNCDLIEWVEANPDTTIRLVSGETIIVLEPPDEVIRRVEDYRKRILASAGIEALLTSGTRPVVTLLKKCLAQQDRESRGSGVRHETEDDPR
jgi:flagellar protein FlbD